MAEDGVLVGKGTFRVDRGAALRKLAAFQLEDESLLVPWVRLAVCSGALRLRVDSGPGRVAIRFDGRPLPAPAVKDPFSALLAAEGRRPELVYLAAGMMGLERFSEKPRLVSGPRGTSVSAAVTRWEALEAARRALPEILCSFPLEVFFEGAKVAQGSIGGLQWRDGAASFSAVPAADPWRRESLIRLVVHGVQAQALSYDTPWASVEAEVRDDSLALDASLTKVASGPAVGRLLASLRGRLRELVRSEALAQTSEAPRLSGLLSVESFRPAWAGVSYPEPGALGVLAERFLGEKPLPREPYEALLRARRRVRWLRACIKGRLNGYESDSKDRTRRALWKTPLFPNADDGWLSYMALVKIRGDFGTVPLVRTRRRWQDIPFARYLGKNVTRPIRAPLLVWRAAEHDAEDLARLFGAGAGKMIP